MHEAVHRGELTAEAAREVLARVRSMPIRLLGDAVLHDGPIQRLTVAALSLDLLANRLGVCDAEVGALLEQTRSQITDEMRALRHLMSELRSDAGG